MHFNSMTMCAYLPLVKAVDGNAIVHVRERNGSRAVWFSAGVDEMVHAKFCG